LEEGLLPPKEFAEPALDTITDYRLPDALRHCQAEPRAGSRRRKDVEDKYRRHEFLAMPEDVPELARVP
jgi:hypothetical protein